MGGRANVKLSGARLTSGCARSISSEKVLVDVDLCAFGGVVRKGAQREAREVRGVSVTGRSKSSFVDSAMRR